MSHFYGSLCIHCELLTYGYTLYTNT